MQERITDDSDTSPACVTVQQEKKSAWRRDPESPKEISALGRTRCPYGALAPLPPWHCKLNQVPHVMMYVGLYYSKSLLKIAISVIKCPSTFEILFLTNAFVANAKLLYRTTPGKPINRILTTRMTDIDIKISKNIFSWFSK